MLTSEMTTRPGYSVLLLRVLGHLIALKLQRSLVQEALARLTSASSVASGSLSLISRLAALKRAVQFLVRCSTASTKELVVNE